MRKWMLSSAIVLGLSACSQSSSIDEIIAPPECKVGNYAQADILVIKAEKYQGLDNDAINQIALDLRSCIGHPNPAIRDGLVYESLSDFLRGDQLTGDTKLQLFNHMISLMNGPNIGSGYTRPFAALNMSELARADRISSYLSDGQREELAQTAASYMANITDHRGYVDNEGWRHNVAHTSDIILQLSLNAEITETQLRTLQAALGTQVAPPSGHAYIHGEPERLARAILYLANRDIISAEDWNKWFAQLADPAPLTTWGEAYTSEVGLAKLHNTKAFLSAIYINANETQNAKIKVLLAPTRDALIKLP